MTVKSSEEKEKFMSLTKRIPVLSRDRGNFVTLFHNYEHIITIDIK